MYKDDITKAVAEAYAKMKQEELKGNQHKIDANKNNKIDAQDFKILRAQKNEEAELEPGQGSHLNLGGARVKNTHSAVLAHVKKTFPNAKEITKHAQYGWGPKHEEAGDAPFEGGRPAKERKPQPGQKTSPAYSRVKELARQALEKAAEKKTKNEAVEGSEPRNEKEKDLAALAEPKNKITHKDVLVGRGVVKQESWGSKKPTVSEENGNLDEDLRKWFDKNDPEGGWKRINSKGEAIGPCAREPGEPKPKCMSNEKRAQLTKKERAAAVAAKRRHDPDPERKGKPINVSNFGKGKLGEDVEYIEEKNAPTNPELWSRAKALARQKFDVYPSAYANGWASKWYKSKGGGWKSVSEEVELDEAFAVVGARENKRAFPGWLNVTRRGGKISSMDISRGEPKTVHDTEDAAKAHMDEIRDYLKGNPNHGWHTPSLSVKKVRKSTKSFRMEEEMELDEGEIKKQNKQKKNAYVASIIQKKLHPSVLPSLKYGRAELKKEDAQLDEKSVSTAQQKFMGMVYATKKGDIKAPSPEVAKAAAGMTTKQARDFAKTKHEGLPAHVTKEEVEEEIDESLMKSVKRGLTLWGGSKHLKDIQHHVKTASDDQLIRLSKGKNERPDPHTPRDLQTKLINRELKRRYGVKPGLKNEEVELNEGNDDVGEMIKDKLKIIINRAKEMHDGIDSNTDMPEWVKSKITLAQDYISTACDYSCGKEQLGEAYGRKVDHMKVYQKSKWMGEFENHVVKKAPQHRGKVDWNSATYLHSQGHSPEAAAEKYVASRTKSEALGANTTKHIGEFQHAETKKHFTYSNTNNEWAKKHGLPHEIDVGPNAEGKRFANVKGTVAHVSVDENDDGSPKIEKWKIRNHNKYQRENYAHVVREVFQKAKEKKMKKDSFNAEPEMQQGHLHNSYSNKNG